MVTDLDIWRSANLLIQQHGDQADLEAAQRADAMLDKGDMGGRLVSRYPGEGEGAAEEGAG